MKKAIPSTDFLALLETKVESHLQVAIDVFQNLSEKTLMMKSPSGGWSVAECMWHLNSYGDFYLPEIEKALSRCKTSNPTFVSGWLGNYFTSLMKPSEDMKKMKAFKNHVPTLIEEPYRIISTFVEQQETLLKLLQTARTADLTNSKVRVSIAQFIQLRLGDVFQFLIAHNERHLLQAKRNLA